MIKIKASDLLVWKKVINIILGDDKRVLNFNLENELIFEGSDSKMYPFIYKLGVFKSAKHGMLAISFRFNSEKGGVDNISVEFREELSGFNSISEDEMINILASIRDEG